MTSSQGRPPGAAADPSPIDRATVQAAIDRALLTGTGRLDPDELTRLEATLREHITALLPAADAATDRLWRGSLAWYTRRARIDGIRHQAGQGLGDGPLSAHIQVTTLARDCQWLLAEHQERT
ncbi:DUF6415 family natural product biosynthesis protein [Streptomyces sp. NPDC001922]|uniref:DUF6415 family natural product biosynthesis protein n=1 Tax=Streptomyces sp. NPDC001922 TaxID=3364624 RepID=UPI0036AD844C